MRHFHIRATFIAVVLFGAGFGLLLTATRFAQANVNHDAVAVENPRTDTPIVLDGTVLASVQLHDRVIVAGEFTRVQTVRNGPIVDRVNLYAYDINTGELIDDFAPVLNGGVQALISSPEDDSFYAGGTFTQVDGQFRGRLAKIHYDGTLDTAFRPSVSAEVRTLDEDAGVVYLGGSFQTINGEPHGQIGAVDATTGATIDGFDLSVTGGLGRGGVSGVRSVIVHPTEDLLLVVSNGQTVTDTAGDHDRYGVAFVDLDTFLVTPWRTQWYEIAHTRCSASSLQLQEAALSPDGSTFAIAEKGNFGCDKIVSFDTIDNGVNDPKWVTAAHDSVFSVEITNNAVYAGGHFCFLEAHGPLTADDAANFDWYPKPEDCDIDSGNQDIDNFSARQQIAALDPANGAILDWNPRTNAQVAVFDIEAIDRGLLIGQDANQVNDVETGRHAFLDFGGTTPVFALPAEPVLECTAEIVGGNVVLEWSENTAGTEVIRRNGAWIASVTNIEERSLTTPLNDADDEYVLRLFESGNVTDVPCTDITPEAEPEPLPGPGQNECFASLDGDSVNLTWGDTSGNTEVIRRNGAWIANVTGQETHTDTPGPGEHAYELRVFGGGTTTDIACGTSPIVIEDAVPVTIECTATLNGNNVELVFSANDASNQGIRRNGAWIGNVTGETTFTDTPPAAGDYTYELRMFQGGQATDVACDPTPVTLGELTPVIRACTVNIGEDSAFLEFTANTSGTQVIRRDGAWIATVNGLDEFNFVPTPRQGDPQGEYVLRLFEGDVTTDVPCTGITQEPEPTPEPTPVPVPVPALDPVNLAFGQPATQSSTFRDDARWAASAAVDGNTSGANANRSITHTAGVGAAWWQVDLGATANISSIDLWNRTDCCTERLNNITVFISNTDMSGRTLAELQADPTVTAYTVDGILGETTTIDTTASGQFVRIELRTSSTLSLAEVFVNGNFQ